ncbi:MAG: DNA polymerase III subunit delta [Rickettsiales bacterium]|nr:DNA polymerase III subunit delta [Rickettsiales bacterium]
MKLNAKEIESFLKAPTQSKGALIYGADRGQMRQRMDAIAAFILTDLADPFNRVDLQYDHIVDEPSALYDELAAMSFTGDRRLIVIREAGDKLTKHLEEAEELLNDQNYLIICADELTTRSSLRKWAESSKAVSSLPCYKDEGQGLAQLIRTTLTGYGYRADEAVVQYLTAHLGGDRMVVLAELEKLSVYFDGEEHLDYEEVVKAIGDSGEKSLDDVAQAAASGNVSQLCRTLDRLYLEGVHAVAILRAVHRYFARLSEVVSLSNQGQSMIQAVKSIRPPVFFKQQSIMASHAQRWNADKLERAMHLMMEAEKDSKLGGDLSSVICSHYLIRIAKAAA